MMNDPRRPPLGSGQTPEYPSLLAEILSQIPIRVFWKNTELRYLGCNTLFARDAGFASPEEVIGKDDFQMAWREQADLYRADDLKVIASGQPKLDYEEPQSGPDGRTIWLRTSKVPLRDDAGNIIGMLGLYEDITDRRMAEMALRESERNLLEAQRIAQTGSWYLELSNNKVTWSHELFIMFGLDPDQPPPDLPAFEQILTANSWKQMNEAFSALINEDKPYEIELEIRDKAADRGWVFSRGEALRDAQGIAVAIRGVSTNITRRKLAERHLFNANRALRALGACNEAMFRAQTESELLINICTLVVQIGDYRMAWIGLAEHDDAKSVRPVAIHGYEDGYLTERHFSWDEKSEFGLGPTGTAIRTRTTQINQNFVTNPVMAPWRDDALKRGYQSSISLPLASGDSCIGALMIYAREPDAFTHEEVELLEDLAHDLTFGIETMRTRSERDRIARIHEEQSIALQKNLQDFVRAISSTVEMRDPYTAGHQHRVSQLAIAIARNLGLSEHTVRGVELAAIVHDLGQINIPAEILCRPGKLNEYEYMLIKQHPETGYETLKDIQFPWPIATIVRQHHERLDGSGYPQGLKGDQILLEARIMAVADVTEAMLSHRPYRPARTMGDVIAELENGSGTRYDKTAVDACLTLLRDKGFTFKN